MRSQGYFFRRDDQVVRILSHGDPSPVGGSFSVTYTYRAASLPQTGQRILNPQFKDSGDVLFAAAVSGGTTIAGIFMYSGGQVRALVVDGESAPFDPALMFDFISTDGLDYSTLLNNISFDPLGGIQFTAWISSHLNDPSTIGIFQLTERGISPVAAVFDPAPGTEGYFAVFPFVAANALGDVVFYSDICCGSYGTDPAFERDR